MKGGARAEAIDREVQWSRDVRDHLFPEYWPAYGQVLRVPIYRAMRAAIGTQEEVAVKLECARQTPSRKETGKSRITMTDLLALRALIGELK